MSQITLKPLDDGQKAVEIPLGKTTIGRGPLLGCSDKKVSRNHAVLEVTNKGEVYLTPILLVIAMNLVFSFLTINPMFFAAILSALKASTIAALVLPTISISSANASSFMHAINNDN
ncbi:uncharacterized protein TNCV_4839291 [Trichonephila clavipes]|nr:uncharacterized protein TNCV_4839291 [Trichonephila clavipes]